MNPSQPTPWLTPALAAVVRGERRWQLLLCLLTGLVLYLALSPSPPKQADLGWDKLNHAAAFAALAMSGCLGFPRSPRTLLCLAALLVLGGLIEILQLFVPGRSSEWADLLADSVGIACGAAIALSLLWMAGLRRRQRA